MPKKSTPASTHSVLFRVAEDEYDILSAMAYLQGVTPTELARTQVITAIESWRENDRVVRVALERREFDAEQQGKLASIGRRPTSAS